MGFRIAMGLMFLVLTSSAFAHGTTQTAAWERQALGQYLSEPGEGLPDFLKRVGSALYAYTNRTGNEACGLIATNGERFSVRLGTDGVQRGCAIHHSDIEGGFQSTGESIHSHPTRTTRLADRDKAWMAAYGMPMASNWNINRKVGFSPEDFTGGPGWLVDNKQLFHQTGPGQVTKHGPIAKSVGP